MKTYTYFAYIIVGIASFVSAYLAMKNKKNDSVVKIALTTILILAGIEWLYVGGYFIFNPEYIPKTSEEIRLMTWIVAPLLIHFPLVGGFLFAIIYDRLKKKS